MDKQQINKLFNSVDVNKTLQQYRNENPEGSELLTMIDFLQSLEIFPTSTMGQVKNIFLSIWDPEPQMFTRFNSRVQRTEMFLDFNNKLLVYLSQCMGTDERGYHIYNGRMGNRVVSVKHLTLVDGRLPRCAAEEEITTLRAIGSHEGILTYIDSQEVDTENFGEQYHGIYIIFEGFTQTLKSFVEDVEDPNCPKVFNPSFEDISYIKQMVSLVEHVHSKVIRGKKMFVGNISPENMVFVKSGGEQSIKFLNLIMCNAATFGTPSNAVLKWSAPELIKGIGWSEPTEIFMLACAIFFCFTGHHPFGEAHRRNKKMKDQMKPNISEVSHIPDLKVLLSGMLDCNPLKRPTLEEVKAHPFFWDGGRRMDFFCLVSNVIEGGLTPGLTIVFARASKLASRANVQNWKACIFVDFLKGMTRQLQQHLNNPNAQYWRSIRGLLRFIRNTKNHPLVFMLYFSNTVDDYFRGLFPRFLGELYKDVSEQCKNEDWFRNF